MTNARRATPLLLLVLILGAFAALPAAADDAPAPDCHGIADNDKPGDAVVAGPGANVSRGKAPDNMDVLAGWITYDGDVATANIQVVNLDESIPDGANGVAWYMFWTDGADENFVHADNSLTGGVTYSYGTTDPSTGVYTDAASTTGKFVKGAKGVIQMRLPAALKVTDGKTLKTTNVRVYTEYQAVAVGSLSAADSAPDSEKGQSVTLDACAAGSAPAGSPGGTAGTPAAPGTSPVTTISVSPKSASAKKVNRKRSLTLTVKASGTVHNVTIKLAKGSKKVGSGRIAELSGTKKVKVKLSKKLKKGRYTLKLAGTGTDGKPVTATIRFTVSK